MVEYIYTYDISFCFDLYGYMYKRDLLTWKEFKKYKGYIWSNIVHELRNSNSKLDIMIIHSSTSLRNPTYSKMIYGIETLVCMLYSLTINQYICSRWWFWRVKDLNMHVVNSSVIIHLIITYFGFRGPRLMSRIR